MKKSFFAAVFLIIAVPLTAQWTPGDTYREYHWVTPAGGEAFLRVGGRYGYQAQPGKLPLVLQKGNELILPEQLDLEGAVRAEVTIEKVLSHEDTRNLRIALNGHPPISVPEPATIPDPSTEYMYHTDLTVPIPLEQLTAGRGLRFQLTVDSTQRWGWPQNLVYGLAFRIFYAPAAAPPKVKVPQQPLAEIAYLSVNASSSVRHVDYILAGNDVDWSGRGVQHRKHWQTHRGEPHHTIGRATDPGNDFSVRWNTAWLPDQDNFGVQARLLGEDGKYRVSEVTGGLRLAPRPYRIAVYAPGPAPRNWVTRSGAFQQDLMIFDSLETATTFQLHWVSWAACYSDGLFLNGHLLWHRIEDCYVYATHSPEFSGHDVKALEQGRNIISTALTPRYRGEMVHGMEVQWPGVQLKVRYDER